MNLQPGDIVLTRSRTGRLGPIIRWFERRTGRPAWPNHVGIITAAGLLEAPVGGDISGESLATLVEALWRVRRGPLWQFYGPPAGPGRPEIQVWRLLAPSSAQRAVAARKAEEFVGRKYAWWELLEHAADWWLTKKRGKETYLFRRIRLFPKREECSGVVEVAWAEGGVSFDVPPGTANPEDIHGYVVKPRTAECIFAGVLGEEKS